MKSLEVDRSLYTFSDRPTPILPINKIKLLDHLLENKFSSDSNSIENSNCNELKCLNTEPINEGNIPPRISFRELNEIRVSTYYSKKMVLFSYFLSFGY